VEVQVVHFVEEMLASDVFELNVTDEHGEMGGSLKIPAGWKLGSAVTIAAVHYSQFGCAFVSHF
jgi:hypothetical protein